MLERLVNEDRAGAEELFHEIVVEKSRDIYELLLAEEAEEDIEETTDEEEDDLDESEEDDLDESEEDDLDESEDEDVDESFFDEMGAEDPVDDMIGAIEMPGADDDMGDMGGDDMGGDDMGMGDEGGDIEDRVMDLEDELEALKAEFEAMMGDSDDDEDEDEEDDEMPMDMDSEEGDDDDDEGDDDGEDKMPFESKGPKSHTEQMREYVEKVSAKMGDNGVNTKSPMAKPNNMGGTTANIVKGGDGGAGGTKGGLAAPTPKDMNTKNVNVPGAKAATKMAAQPGHGAEKKGKPETADKGAGSPLNGAPKRAK